MTCGPWFAALRRSLVCRLFGHAISAYGSQRSDWCRRCESWVCRSGATGAAPGAAAAGGESPPSQPSPRFSTGAPRKVDRDQVRRDIESFAGLFSRHCRALLAELEEAEERLCDK